LVEHCLVCHINYPDGEGVGRQVMNCPATCWTGCGWSLCWSVLSTSHCWS